MATASVNPIDFIQQAVYEYIQDTQAPGVCVSLLDLNSSIPEFQSGYIYPSGFRVIEQIPLLLVDNDTMFRVGSVTKVFTSLLTAYGVIEQKAKLTDPAINYLQNYSGVTANNQNFNNIKLADLATHTSGIPEHVKSVYAPSKQLFNDESPSQELVSYWSSYAPPSGLFANCWLYSDLAFVTLGFAVSGILDPQTPQQNTYNQLLSSIVTGPLNMNGTSAHFVGDDISTGYQWVDGQNKPAVGPGIVAFDLKSSGTDMLTFLQAHLNAPGLTIPPELAQAIALTHKLCGKYPKCGNPNEFALMGLGWDIDEVPGRSGNFRLLTKNGEVPGGRCVIQLVPKAGFGIAVLTNQSVLSDQNDQGRPTPGTLATRIRNQITSLQ